MTATFSFSLSVSMSGDGTGSVTGPGIACGVDCAQTYVPGTVVTLTRAVGAGSGFGGWGDDCSPRGTNASCALTMNTNHVVTASFLGPRTLVVSKTGRGNGSVTSGPAGIACGADCSHTYPYGTVVTLTTAVASGSVFEGFTGCDSTPTTTSCRVTMTADRTVGAVFNPPGGLAVMIIGKGTVVSDDGLINCGLGGTQCQVRYPVGKRVVLSTSAAPDSFFDRWFGACPATRESCAVDVPDQVRVVSALFGSAAVLTISFPGNGARFVDHAGGLPGNGPRCMSGAPCTVFVEPGKTVVLTATATAGLFSEWGGDCAGIPRDASCQLVVVGTRSVSATFLADPVTARLLSDQHVAIAANGVPCDQPCDRFFERGTAVTFEALPRPGRIFTGWSGDCASLGNASCVLEMTGNRTVSASAFVERYALTLVVNNDQVEGGGGSQRGVVLLTPSGELHSCESATTCTWLFAPDETVTVEAVSFDLFTVFGFFGGDCSNQSNPCTLTMDQDRPVEAVFFLNCDPDPLNCGN